MINDQQLIDKFLSGFTDEIVRQFGEKIDFILLFGSAARGEFVKGASDIDLIIQTKSSSDIKRVEVGAETLFWKLDKKYDLEFKKVLSTTRTKNPIENLFHQIEARAHLFKPIFVLGPEEIDWKNGTLKTKRLNWKLGATFLASLSTTLLKLKKEGKILYGRDIRAEIHPKFNFWERWKGIWLPFYLAIISILIFPIIPKEGLKLATKAVFWQIDAVLVYLGKVAFGQKEKLTQVLESKLKIPLTFARFNLKLLPERSFSAIAQADQIRKSNFKTPFFAGWFFCFKSLFFVIITGWLANFKLFFQFILAKNL